VLTLDGTTPPEVRERRIAAFQAGEADVFLISLKAGGFGLNLTAADTVIHLDPWWNPAVEDQATARAHRMGQLRPVTAVRLVARGTIEEAVLELHAAKRKLAAAVLEGSDAAGSLDTDELIDLIRRGDRPV
jgi:SNF2 family DNA or RNA helicase